MTKPNGPARPTLFGRDLRELELELDAAVVTARDLHAFVREYRNVHSELERRALALLRFLEEHDRDVRTLGPDGGFRGAGPARRSSARGL